MSGASSRVGLAALGGCGIASAARAKGIDTHGRWPWVAAIAAPTVTAVSYEHRQRFSGGGRSAIWVSLPVLLWHQTEEWVLPSGFLPWFNRSVWQSGEDEFPVTAPMAFRINVIAGWGLSAVAALTIRRAPWLASGVLASHFANGALHVGLAIEQRRYNPGLVTALILGPLGMLGAAGMMRGREFRSRGALVGIAAGLAASAALPASLRLRMRATKRDPEAS